MAILAALPTLGFLLSIVYAALGLGFVIFVHELGHFLVAKWCGVRVERFSIGFGPVLLSFMRGETEYALSIIPFGGYVKMLGQDDVDPNQMASEEIAQDPRSYTAKSVPQRMAIISAGVIMNIITGTLMFGLAFFMGLDGITNVIGKTGPGSPAWKSGLLPGDTITEINGYPIRSFLDIMRRVTLSWGEVHIRGTHADGTAFEYDIKPEQLKKGDRYTIGVSRPLSLKLYAETPYIKGTTAEQAQPALQGRDVIRSVNGQAVKTDEEFQAAMIKHRTSPVQLQVERIKADSPPNAEKPVTELVEITLPAQPFLSTGLKMDMGQISAIQSDSPAAGKLQVGDKITHVKLSDKPKREIGLDLNPLRLPDYLAEGHGKPVVLSVKREKSGAEPETLDIELTPQNHAGWSEVPASLDSPMSIPAIGVTTYVLHTVLAIEPGSPAEGLIKPQDQIKSVEFVVTEDGKADAASKKDRTIEFGDEQRNWPLVFWTMQSMPQAKLKLTLVSQGATREVEVQAKPAKDWYNIERGLARQFIVVLERDESLPVALQHGVRETGDRFQEIYLVLYSLLTGRLPFQQLNGPLGIVGSAVEISNQGFAPLLFFLAYLSINLAVLNFLPIPILDGGHMVFLIYEGLRGKPASERVVIAATYVGLAMILLLMVCVMFLDISRFFS